MKVRANIIGLGFYVPEKVLTNHDLEKIVDTSDEWIITRTGIRERRMVKDGQACSDLAYEASIRALEHAEVKPEELTHIIVATFTPDYCTPTTACVLQAKLGAKNCQMAMDVAAGCSGFTYAIDAARGIIHNYPDAKMLVVGSEVCTSRLNFQDRSTCVLFGDGAGAVVIAADEKKKRATILDCLLRADGGLGYLLPVGKEGGSAKPYKVGDTVTADYFINMNGPELFKHAVRGMSDMTLRILKKNGLSPDDLDLFIPHQANLRIIDSIAKRLSFPKEKIYINVDRYGNTSAASVIIALSEAYSKGLIKPGYKVLLVAFGAGLTWGSVLIEFNKERI